MTIHLVSIIDIAKISISIYLKNQDNQKILFRFYGK